jgi:hypothetical protein
MVIEAPEICMPITSHTIVRVAKIQPHGGYGTRRQNLDISDRMQEAIYTGQPYQALLEPPLADPSVAHPPRGSEQ